MPRLLALEFNGSEVRVVLASPRGRRLLIDEVFAVGGEDLSAGLAAALAQRGLTRAEALVAISRTSIELRQFSVPPAPADELPDLVRLQALREFNKLEEDWRLDYLPLESQPGQPIGVLAAAIDPEVAAAIQARCDAAGVKPLRLVLRPCAAASLLNRAGGARAGQLLLLVDIVGDEVDLTAVQAGGVTFLRTARLAGDPLDDADAAALLLGEIRRTIAAVQNQSGGKPVEGVLLCGAGEPAARLAAAWGTALGRPIELFDPLAAVELTATGRSALPERPSRFAPLIGMLLDEWEQKPQAIDFLHPRRRTPPPDRRRQYIMAGAAGLALVASYLGYLAWRQGRLDDRIAELTRTSATWNQPAERADKLVKAADDLQKWLATDVVWLDELRELAGELPPAADVMLTQITVTAATTGGGGEIKLEGLARNTSDIDKLEEGLRDKRHRVEGRGRRRDDAQKGYSWRFVSSLIVEEDK